MSRIENDEKNVRDDEKGKVGEGVDKRDKGRWRREDEDWSRKRKEKRWERKKERRRNGKEDDRKSSVGWDGRKEKKEREKKWREKEMKEELKIVVGNEDEDKNWDNWEDERNGEKKDDCEIDGKEGGNDESRNKKSKEVL